MAPPAEVPAVSLPSGGRMPVVGFGTWRMRHDNAYQAVLAALSAGYRSIDTATMYANEADVGRAIKDSGLDRSEIFITTKIRPSDAGKARSVLRHSLSALGTEHLDLWLVHWPPSQRGGSRQLWNELIEIQAEGHVTDIGVSNYTLPELDELTRSSGQNAGAEPDRLGPVSLRRWRTSRPRGARDRRRGLQRAEEHRPGRSRAREDSRCPRREHGPGSAPLAPGTRHRRDPEVRSRGPNYVQF